MEDKSHDAMLYLLGSWPGEDVPEGEMHPLMHKYTHRNPIFRNFQYDTNGSRPYSEGLEQMMQQFTSTGIIDICLFRGRTISQGMKELLVNDPDTGLTNEDKEYLSKTARNMYEDWLAGKKKHSTLA
jgi:hypothetical protein